MSSPTLPLLGTSFRTWLSAKGFWLATAAALVPLVLTSTWVVTHRADVTASPIEMPDSMLSGENVTFRAYVENTGPIAAKSFNVTMRVGTVGFQNSMIPEQTESVAIERLEPGERREVTMSWTAQGGVRAIALWIDEADSLPEVDEHDNFEADYVNVAFRPGGDAPAPEAPEAIAGDPEANATADFAVTSLRRTEARAGEMMTLEATVENRGTEAGEARVGVARYEVLQGATYQTGQTTETVTLGPGESTTVAFETPAQDGAFWHQAHVEPPNGTRELTPEDNHLEEPYATSTLDAELELPEAPERQTIKDFYLSVLNLLHLRLLLPFVALFYAAGVVVDERERGSLAYILTRPVPRWLIPLTKFAASFAVAVLAAVIGLVLTYALLFQATPQGGDAGYFLTPLLVGILTLFAYGALFTLMGVWSRRPYLLGVAWVLGWELVAYSFAPWVRRLTVRHYIDTAFGAWPLGEGFHWLPTTSEGTTALFTLLVGCVAMLVAASVMMKRREFEV